MNNEWLQSYSGRKIYPLDFNVDQVSIYDIAHSSSMICRYLGHCAKFYCLAEHCYHVSYLCENFPLKGLMHDSGETILVDVPRPVKYSPLFAPYRVLEHEVQSKLYIHFTGDAEEPAEVKEADRIMLYNEIPQLFNVINEDVVIPEVPFVKVYGWTPEVAKRKFLERYEELSERNIRTAAQGR